MTAWPHFMQAKKSPWLTITLNLFPRRNMGSVSTNSIWNLGDPVDRRGDRNSRGRSFSAAILQFDRAQCVPITSRTR